MDQAHLLETMQRISEQWEVEALDMQKTEVSVAERNEQRVASDM